MNDKPPCTRCGEPATPLCPKCIRELDKMHAELVKLDPREPFVRE